jgi:hypothetical protein
MLDGVEERFSWDAVAPLPTVPPPALAEDDVLPVGQLRYWECGYSGWHLMLGWLAGPEMLIEDDRNSYLRQAGLPADRAHGYRWFQVLPTGLLAADLHRVRRDTARVRLETMDDLRRAVPSVRQAIQRLY